MNKAKECPFCGGINIVHIYEDVNKVRVFCSKCKASTGNYKKHEDALINWNERINDEEMKNLNNNDSFESEVLKDYHRVLKSIDRRLSVRGNRIMWGSDIHKEIQFLIGAKKDDI
jgi:Lar family restriction alleviation protein